MSSLSEPVSRRQVGSNSRPMSSDLALSLSEKKNHITHTDINVQHNFLKYSVNRTNILMTGLELAFTMICLGKNGNYFHAKKTSLESFWCASALFTMTNKYHSKMHQSWKTTKGFTTMANTKVIIIFILHPSSTFS